MRAGIFLCFFVIFFGGEISAQGIAYKDTVFTNYLRRTQGWTAGDGTISVPLPDGRTIWLFGDSYIDNVDSNNSLPCLFQVRNCMMLQDTNPENFTTCMDTTNTGVNRTTFKLALNDSALFWPGHGFVKNDTAFIFLRRFKINNLAYLGNYVARIYIPDFTIMGIDALPLMNGIIFGAAAIVDTSSNYVFIYGSKMNNVSHVFEPYVARCSLDNIFGSWEFYTGSGWSDSAVLANKISTDAVSSTYSVVKLQSPTCGYAQTG